MIPPAELYPELQLDEQVQLQMIVIQHLADELRDMPDFNDNAFRELITFELHERLETQKKREHYELCALLRDAIKTVQHISIRQLL